METSDKYYIRVDCPDCGTDHRVHKIQVAQGAIIRCQNCGHPFITLKRGVIEGAFIKAFDPVEERT